MKRNSNHYSASAADTMLRPAYIVDLEASKRVDDASAWVLGSKLALMLEPSPQMELALQANQQLQMKLGLMVPAKEMVCLVILRAGRHVCVAAMDCGDPEVAQLLETSKESNQFHVGFVGKECRRLETFGAPLETLSNIDQLAYAAPMELDRYLALAHRALADACSPTGMAAAGLDPRRVRSIGTFVHVGRGLLGLDGQTPKQQNLPLH